MTSEKLPPLLATVITHPGPAGRKAPSRPSSLGEGSPGRGKAGRTSWARHVLLSPQTTEHTTSRRKMNMSVRRECPPTASPGSGSRAQWTGPHGRGCHPHPTPYTPQVGVSAAEQQGRSLEQRLPRGAQRQPRALAGHRAGRGASGCHQAAHLRGEEQAWEPPVLRLRGCRSGTVRQGRGGRRKWRGGARTPGTSGCPLQTPRGSAPTWACSPASSALASTASWACASRAFSPSPWTCWAPPSYW